MEDVIFVTREVLPIVFFLILRISFFTAIVKKFYDKIKSGDLGKDDFITLNLICCSIFLSSLFQDYFYFSFFSFVKGLLSVIKKRILKGLGN